jgi:hypothetical protein
MFSQLDIGLPWPGEHSYRPGEHKATQNGLNGTFLFRTARSQRVCHLVPNHWIARGAVISLEGYESTRSRTTLPF